MPATDFQTTVLVLDGEQRAALAVARSLGRHQCLVHVGSHVRRSIAGGSRFVTGEHLIPDPLEGNDGYVHKVAALARDLKSEVIVPVTEGATLALLEQPRLLPDLVVPTSDLEHFRRASNKAALLELAGSLGMAVPKQWTVFTASDAASIPPDAFPLVIKPARSVVGDPGGRRHKVGVRYASSPAGLRVMLDELGEVAGPFLIQARIEGPGLGVFLLRWQGRILASFAHRRIREKPPSGGVSVCCESVEPPPGLLATSVRLLEALQWNGVAMIEYKRDLRTGIDYLMEINPRFWGSLQLAIDAGVDFPWLLLRAALGQPLDSVTEWRVGVRSRWCWGEIDHLLTRLRHSRESLDLPAAAPGLLATAAQILTPWRPRQRSDVFRLSDPLPALRESIAWFQAL